MVPFSQHKLTVGYSVSVGPNYLVLLPTDSTPCTQTTGLWLVVLRTIALSFHDAQGNFLNMLLGLVYLTVLFRHFAQSSNQRTGNKLFDWLATFF